MTKSSAENLKEYSVGDRDTRPWGEYEVTGVGLNEAGEEYCEKIITVNPGQILSLQSHEQRRERWTVREGTLTVVVDGKRLELPAGQSIDMPLKAIHCMANTQKVPCKVYEKQEGVCREEDIIRYVDAYGRGTLQSNDANVKASVERYNEVLKEIKS